MKNRFRLIRVRPISFKVTTDDTNVSLGFVNSSFYNRNIAILDIYYKKKWTCLDIPCGDSSKDFHHSCQTKPMHSRRRFKKAPVGRIAFAMNTKTAFTWRYFENPFCYQHLDLRQIIITQRWSVFCWFCCCC